MQSMSLQGIAAHRNAMKRKEMQRVDGFLKRAISELKDSDAKHGIAMQRSALQSRAKQRNTTRQATWQQVAFRVERLN